MCVYVCVHEPRDEEGEIVTHDKVQVRVKFFISQRSFLYVVGA